MFKKVFCLLFVFSWIWHGPVTAQSITVKDQAGRQLTVSHPVNRVVTTFIPATMFALCAGLSDKLVGASSKGESTSIYEALIDPEKPPVIVGSRSSGLNLETIFSLKPDLVIMYGQKDGIRLADRITKMGVPAIIIVPESMDAVKQALDLIGQAAGRTGHTHAVIDVMENIENKITAALSGTRKKKVYYAGSRLLTTVSGDMLQNEMIETAGGINVSKETRGFFVGVSREQLLSWNPETILTSARLAPDELKKLSTGAFSSIDGVRTHSIYQVPPDTYWDFPSPLAMAGIIWMAGCIHPELFPQETVNADIRLLYDTIFSQGFSKAHPETLGQKAP